MRKVDELRGPSCLTNAADDEPIFVLKSTDELAPRIVRDWAHKYRQQKMRQPEGMTPKQEAKCEEAFMLATAMEEWRRAQKTT